MNKEDIKFPSRNTFSQTYDELIIDKIYEKYFEVQKGDIIMDIGCNIGLFPLSVENRFSKCYAIEPDHLNFNCLKENLKNRIGDIIFINEGISNKNTISTMTDNVGTGMIVKDGDINGIVNRNLKTLFNNYKIDNIDFLKLDCEGGEYFIFTKENKDILKNINIISGEVHTGKKDIKIIVGPDNTIIKEKDILKMLEILEEQFDVIYTSIDGIIQNDIKNKLDYYEQFLFYANNKKLKNKITIDFKDGYITTKSERFDINNPKELYFIDIDNDQIIYNDQITNINQWHKTTKSCKNCKVILGVKEVTVSERTPKKIITF